MFSKRLRIPAGRLISRAAPGSAADRREEEARGAKVVQVVLGAKVVRVVLGAKAVQAVLQVKAVRTAKVHGEVRVAAALFK